MISLQSSFDCNDIIGYSPVQSAGENADGQPDRPKT